MMRADSITDKNVRIHDRRALNERIGMAPWTTRTGEIEAFFCAASSGSFAAAARHCDNTCRR